MSRGHPLAGVGLDIEAKGFDLAMEVFHIVRLSTGFSPQVVALITDADGNVVARGFNQPISTHDPTAQAEIVAMREAAKAIGNYRLAGLTLYCTMEPCLMCAGAMIHARIKRL